MNSEELNSRYWMIIIPDALNLRYGIIDRQHDLYPGYYLMYQYVHYYEGRNQLRKLRSLEAVGKNVDGALEHE